jgi:hypothetical protein
LCATAARHRLKYGRAFDWFYTHCYLRLLSAADYQYPSR